ncbi:hypothetical protein EG68_12204 [Paragonimus skrjabini miyazakii]|uniref:Uncharacterized protein n=1 Tax=Paragonimus skrjabini miyazakii TaxID=59628 RepID=A0A8S9YD93_9TREM|nr:hypothetical protein EG68_12204 [Paragonimus skrjabini miyazakii]
MRGAARRRDTPSPDFVVRRLESNGIAVRQNAGAKQLHMCFARLRAPTLSGLVSQMMQTVLHPVFAKQVNHTGLYQKIAFRDSKTLAIMREVIIAREGA